MPTWNQIFPKNAQLSAVGIDLTGNPVRPSGWSHLAQSQANSARLRSDDDLFAATVACQPAVISLDSPLALPAGRCCVDQTCPCASHGIMRQAERDLRRMGIGVYPALLPSMVKLTLRGIALKQRFEAAGYTVIEGYPGAAQDILGIPRRKRDVAALRTGLEAFGLQLPARRLVHDELDAITAALVGQFYQTGLFQALGPPDQVQIIIPQYPISPSGIAAPPQTPS